MKWSEFTAISSGTRIFNYGFDECVALANHYHERVLGGRFVPIASAHQWWSTRQANVDAIYTRSSKPVAGAVVVWDHRFGNSHGHIGVVTRVLPDGRFQTMEQNAGHGQYRYVNRYTRGITGVLGFLVPRNNPATPPRPFITKEEEYLMTSKIVYITDNAKTNPFYLYNPIAGTKRKVASREWRAIRKIEAAKGLEVALVEISTDELNAISNG